MPIGFLTDHNVATAVGLFLVDRGHDAVRVADIMEPNSPDPVVATAAMEAGRILVSWDKDFNHQRFLQQRFAALSRIGFSCPEPAGVQRLGEVIDLIEFVFERAAGLPLRIKIGRDRFLNSRPLATHPRRRSLRASPPTPGHSRR